MTHLMIGREPISDALFDEMLPLIERHYKEVAHYGDIPLEIDRPVYLNAEANGALRVYTVRSAFRRLVGYAFFFVRANPHYASSVQAVQDVLYVAPEERGRGGWFIAQCELQLRAEGVQAVYHHVKVAHNWGKLLERMGYEPVDVIWAKRLDTPSTACRGSYLRGGEMVLGCGTCERCAAQRTAIETTNRKIVDAVLSPNAILDDLRWKPVADDDATGWSTEAHELAPRYRPTGDGE